MLSLQMETDGFEPPSSGLEPKMLAINTMFPVTIRWQGSM